MSKPIETQLRQGIEICAVQNYGEIQEKAPPDRQGSGRGVWRLQNCFLLLPMVDEHHPLFHKYLARVSCMNIVKHITRLVKSDKFLAAVCGVWLCSMIAWGAMI